MSRCDWVCMAVANCLRRVFEKRRKFHAARGTFTRLVVPAWSIPVHHVPATSTVLIHSAPALLLRSGEWIHPAPEELTQKGREPNPWLAFGGARAMPVATAMPVGIAQPVTLSGSNAPLDEAGYQGPTGTPQRLLSHV
eukprot:674300-Amphidinium_carterae.1